VLKNGPEFLNAQSLETSRKLLLGWGELLAEIRKAIMEISPQLERHKDSTSERHGIVSEIGMAQFFTFSSVSILIGNAHFSDAFTLLRVLYEGHLHLWNLWHCDQEELSRFFALKAIHEWDVAASVTTIENTMLKDEHYTPQKMNILRSQYEEAIQLFNCRPDKIPRNYTTKSIASLAKAVGEFEGGRPFRQLMHSRLYSSGSEYIHRSFYGLREGYAVLPYDEKKRVLAPNPERGIEAAWWAASIELDTVKWHSLCVGFNDGVKITEELRSNVHKLAKEWLIVGPEEQG
jgi:hypothetical protein